MAGFEAGGKLFGKQLLAVVGCAAYSFVIGYGTIKVLEKFMRVVPGEDEMKVGLDVSMHGAKAYTEDGSVSKKGSANV